MKRAITITVCALALCLAGYAQNPFLPLWEFIPDAEPYVFEDPDNPGHHRVYIYGSHDTLENAYCGVDFVCWSAPVDNLLDWRYEGRIFESLYDGDGKFLNESQVGDVLYAPDVTVKRASDGSVKYYLYSNNTAGGRRSQTAVSDRPDGPFKVCNWKSDAPNECYGVLGFDPAVFVDDDGRVYGYWGFGESRAAELDPETMCTVKPGCEIIHNLVSGYKQEGVFRFYEASSMRKVQDKYIFIFARFSADGDFGLPGSCYTLAYAYGDSPLGPFTYGGTIIDGRAHSTDAQGRPIITATEYGNTHGSIFFDGKQWWVIYHRQTGRDQYSRQTMVAPIEIKIEKGRGGKVSISEAEYNSEGFRIQGLDPFAVTSAGLACYHKGPVHDKRASKLMYFSGSYVQATRDGSGVCTLTNNTSGSVAGYKYFDFRQLRKARKPSLTINLQPCGIDGHVDVYMGGPEEALGGIKVGAFDIKASDPRQMTSVKVALGGLGALKGDKQPLFFRFSSPEEGKSTCIIYDFKFNSR